ncbi:MAG TPA: hypothetical protein DD827_09140, partial [Gammaproteobacteria bacterium]|nr:hypothetical protein [Gammaproteobacteria bacterium]
MKIILFFSRITLVLMLGFPVLVSAGGEVSVIYTEEVDGSEDAAVNQYSADGNDYRWGVGRNLKITGFRYNDKDYDYRSVANSVVIRRVDNDESTGERCALFAERDGGNNRRFLSDYPDDGSGSGNCDMAEVMGGRIINRGVLDLFANAENSYGSHKNIERVDFITSGGIVAPTDADDLSEAGHVATEKSGNNPVQIAAILSLDENGDPAEYGFLVMVNPASNSCSGICYGITNVSTTNSFVVNEDNPPHSGVYYTGNASTESLGMAFISLEDLGIAAGQTYYGFSYFGTDVDADIHELTDPGSFPLNSEGQSSGGPGQADVYGGTAGVFVEEDVEIEVPDPEDAGD